MKKFLLHTAVFSIVVLTLVVCAEVYVERLPNSYRDKHAYMLQHSDEVETLVLGSSHTYYGVCPSDLGERAFSLANISQTYRYDLYMLNHYDMPRLKNVIVPFSYFSLWEDFEDQELDNMIIAYRLYMDCDIHQRMGRYGLECFFLPSFREKLKSLYQPRRMYWDKRGWGLEYTLEARGEDWDNGRDRALRNTYTDTTSVAGNVQRLDSIARWCEARDVRLILVHTPVTASFADAVDARQEHKNEEVLNGFLQRHPSVKDIDVRRDARFVDADFYDGDHLNQHGAHKLSGILRDALR